MILPAAATCESLVLCMKVAMPDGTESSVAKPNQPESSPSGMTAASKARVDLGDITPHNIKLLKKINQVRLPFSPIFT